jgi:DNA-binding FadR family transcriptional regulator
VIVAADRLGRPFRFHLGTRRLLEDLKYLIELRVPLEIEAAALAAVRRTKKDLADMQTALDGMAHAVQEGSDGVDADVEFHRRIAIATGNPHFIAFTDFLGPFIRRGIRMSRMNTAEVPNRPFKVQGEHDRIFEAILSKKPKEAAEAASVHVRNTVKRLGTLAPDIIRRAMTENVLHEEEGP